ncbi:MAG: xanthine dehydrogenase family protein molybdopterin-binding subunit [Thermomicrobiales bacterium]
MATEVVTGTESVLGKSVIRVDGRDKVTGRARYTGDLRLPEMLYAKLVLSMHARARIMRIDDTAARQAPGVVDVITARELRAAAPEGGDRLLLALDRVDYYGQPVVAVLAESASAAEDGAAAVVVEYAELPAAVETLAAMADDAPAVKEGGADEDETAQMHATVEGGEDAPKRELPVNVSNSAVFTRGDVAAGFQQAAHIVEHTYRTTRVHQSYLEPQSTVAATDPFGNVQVYASTQAMFHVRSATARALGRPETEVKVTAMPVGGGFGAKFMRQEPLVAALALKSGRPVQLVLARSDDYLSTTPAPESIITLKTGVAAGGTITAIQARVVFDGGASGGTPMNVACLLLGGYYRCENLHIEGFEVLTNKPNPGAYRAPGAPQGTFAIESNINEMAAAVGMDPIAFRLKNCAGAGDPMPNGQPWPNIGLRECLEAIQRHPLAQDLGKTGPGEGVGVAVGGWLMGVEPSAATCKLNTDGSLSVLLGSVDLTGTNTAFAQIAAEAFGVSLDKIKIVTGDSDAAPYAGGSGGSKIMYTVGPSVLQAAQDARQQVLAIAADMLEAAPEDLEIVDGAVQVKGFPEQRRLISEIAGASMRFGGMYKPVTGRGQTATTERAPGFAAHLVRVKVDPETGEARLTQYVAAQDVGFAINPEEVIGQIRGGVAQGIGWALLEGMVYDEDGRLLNASLLDYALPNAENVPPIETILVEKPAEFGPFGAKGVGEPPVIPGAAAIANAVASATGARITELPLTAQRIATALSANGAGK